MKGMRGSAVLAFGAAIVLAVSGRDLLPRSRDITTVELMQVLALDEGEKGELRVTAASGVHSGGSGGEHKPPLVLASQASAVLAACMELQSKGSGYAAFSHVEQVVLSAGASQRSTRSLLDFLERDPETRLDTLVYVTQGEAGEMVEQVCSKEHAAAELLEALGREMPVESLAWPVTVRELLTDLGENSCALVPVLELEEEGEQTGLKCRKMGWFQEGKFCESLTEEQSRAAAMLEDKLGSAAMEVELEKGSRAGVRLTQSRCRWRPVWQGEELAGIALSLDVKGDLAEVQGNADLREERIWEQLREQLEKKVQGEVEEVLERSRRAGEDFLHLQRKMRLQCPGRYRRIDEDWKEWFPQLEMRVQVRAVLERSYDLNEGAGI